MYNSLSLFFFFSKLYLLDLGISFIQQIRLIQRRMFLFIYMYLCPNWDFWLQICQTKRKEKNKVKKKIGKIREYWVRNTEDYCGRNSAERCVLIFSPRLQCKKYSERQRITFTFTLKQLTVQTDFRSKKKKFLTKKKLTNNPSKKNYWRGINLFRRERRKNAEINRINLQHVIIPPNYSLQNKTEKKKGKRKERKNNRNKSIKNVTTYIYTADFRSKVSKTKSKKKKKIQ